MRGSRQSCKAVGAGIEGTQGLLARDTTDALACRGMPVLVFLMGATYLVLIELLSSFLPSSLIVSYYSYKMILHWHIGKSLHEKGRRATFS